ncbi:preprotein translocase subunit YajC [Ruminococcus sp.]|uniref:preprotein translocase subunit YajC n=1 Tax=Ruminococcus sp. TaxID=41978 RepID=UPI000564FDEA|nr:preprotein translocase subunit YajC [Ruminococcus sp.]
MKRKIAAIATSAIVTASSAMYSAMSAFATEGGNDAANGGNQKNMLLTFVLPLGFFFVILYFMLIRPQKKREQEQKELQSNVQIGDEVITTGGIIGIVVRVAEDNIVIETGGERTKIRMKNWAIAENVSAKERAKAAAPKKKTALETAAAVDETDKKSKKKKKDEE